MADNVMWPTITTNTFVRQANDIRINDDSFMHIQMSAEKFIFNNKKFESHYQCCAVARFE